MAGTSFDENKTAKAKTIGNNPPIEVAKSTALFATSKNHLIKLSSTVAEESY